jgi:hypothetical protein
MSGGGVMSVNCHEGCLKAEHYAGRHISAYKLRSKGRVFYNFAKKMKLFLNFGYKKAGIQYRQRDSASAALSCRYQHECTLVIIEISFILPLAGMQSRAGRRQEVG